MMWYMRDSTVRLLACEVHSARCLAQDTVGRVFARGDKEEDVSVTIVVGLARTIFEGSRPGGVVRRVSVVRAAAGERSRLDDENQRG